MPKFAGLFIFTSSMDSRTDAELARYDQLMFNWDKAGRIPGIRALNPDCVFLQYKNAMLCNDWGASAIDGTTGVSATELLANPDWALKALLTEVYTDSVLRDSPAAIFPLQRLTPGVEPSLIGTYSADIEGAGLTLGAATLDGRATDVSVDFGGTGILTGFPIAGGTDYTFDGWAQIDALTAGRQTLIGSNGALFGRIALQVRSDGFPAFFSTTNGEGQTWFQDTVPVGEPFHWAMVWRTATREAEFFVNGESYGVVTLDATIDGAHAGNLTIGAWHPDLAHEPINGRISHVSVYGHAVRKGRLLSHYVNGPTVTPAGGEIIESALFPDNFLGNPGHPDYQAQWISNVLASLAKDTWTGMYADDVDDTAGFHFGSWIGMPGAPYDAMTDDDLRPLVRNFLVNVGTAIRAAGYKFWINLANSADVAIWSDWLTLCDGSFREFFKKFGTGDSTGIPISPPATGDERFADAEFPFDQAFLEATAALGGNICPITYGVAADHTAQAYAYASFLLDWVQASDWCYAFAKQGVEDVWTPYWTRDIGNPTEAKRTVATNCFSREFTNGLVLVNGSSSPHTFDTSELAGWGGFTLLDGSPVGATLTLQPATGEVIGGQRPVPPTHRSVSLPRHRGKVLLRPALVLRS